MAKNSSYHVPFRRRRNGKTNFHRRKRLLRSSKYRIITRRSNRHVRVSIVSAKVVGDETLVDASSQHLKEYGWKAPTGNTPAAYLTGYLAGKYAQAMNVKGAILDIGINNCEKNTRVSAMLCGAVNAGLKIPHDKEVFPTEDRYTGKVIADFSAQLKKKDPKKHEKQFSGYKKISAKPESLPTYFKATIKAIDAEFSAGTMKAKLKGRTVKNKKPHTKKPSAKKPSSTAAKKTTTKKPTTTAKKTTTTKKTTTSTAKKPSTTKKASTSTKPKK